MGRILIQPPSAFTMAILSEDMMNAMRIHRYSSEGHSILDCGSLFKFIAKKLPNRLSPNSLTILGLSSSCIACILAVYQSCCGNEEGFRAMTYLCVIGYFIWLICDNVDGILARLRGVSSPFGELLDHGGDAAGLLLASTSIISCFNFRGDPLVTFAYVLTDVAACYISEPCSIYISGILHKESIDFNEVILLYMTVSWSTAKFGTSIWLYEIIPVIKLQFRYIFYILKFYIIFMLLLGKLPTFFTTDAADTKPRKFKLQPIFPLFIVLATATVAYITSSDEFIQQYVVQLTLSFGFSIVKLHIELLIAHIGKSDFRWCSLSLAFPVALAFGVAICDDPRKEMLVTLLSLVLIVSDVVVYFVRLLIEIYYAMDVRLCVLDDNANVEKS